MVLEVEGDLQNQKDGNIFLQDQFTVDEFKICKKIGA